MMKNLPELILYLIFLYFAKNDVFSPLINVWKKIRCLFPFPFIDCIFSWYIKHDAILCDK